VSIQPVSSSEAQNARQRAQIESIMRTELGPTFIEAMDDPETTDLRFNGHGMIVVKQRGIYRQIGSISPASALRVIYTIGQLVGAIINDRQPIFAGEFPLDGSRMQILLPPAVDSPVLVLRMRARKKFSFEDLVGQDVLTATQASFMTKAIATGEKNLVVSGGTGSGKTTLCNAVLQEIAKYPRMLVLLEDEKELQPSSDPIYLERLYAKKGFGRHPDVSMHDLLAVALRLDPNIIAMGELRQPLAAVALVEAFNTGHRGGFVTYHADSALDAVYRLQWLVAEGGMNPLPHRLAKAINILVHMKEVEPGVRRVVEVAELLGHDGVEYQLKHVA
jgi:type IV secretion system protein VirB11